MLQLDVISFPVRRCHQRSGSVSRCDNILAATDASTATATTREGLNHDASLSAREGSTIGSACDRLTRVRINAEKDRAGELGVGLAANRRGRIVQGKTFRRKIATQRE